MKNTGQRVKWARTSDAFGLVLGSLSKLCDFNVFSFCFNQQIKMMMLLFPKGARNLVWTEVQLLLFHCFQNAWLPPTSAEVTGCKLRILRFSFQFAWSREPCFRNDKYRLAASCCFLAPGRLQAPGNTSGSWGWRSSCAHRPMHYAAPRQTGFLLESRLSGGMIMMLESELPGFIALKRHFWPQSHVSFVTISLTPQLSLRV